MCGITGNSNILTVEIGDFLRFPCASGALLLLPEGMITTVTEQKAIVMDKDRQPYTSYLLRLWPTKSGDAWVWRASLEDSHTGVRRGFVNLQEMFAYLEDQTDRQLKN